MRNNCAVGPTLVEDHYSFAIGFVASAKLLPVSRLDNSTQHNHDRIRRVASAKRSRMVYRFAAETSRRVSECFLRGCAQEVRKRCARGAQEVEQVIPRQLLQFMVMNRETTCAWQWATGKCETAQAAQEPNAANAWPLARRAA